MAVDGFFVLSGYLITRSYLSTSSPARYLWRRFIRIFPAFWVCLALTALVCAPLVLLRDRGTIAGADWFGAESPVSYVVSNGFLRINQWDIWYLLSSVPQTRMQLNFGIDPGAIAFDRSLWTLTYEWDSYLLVAIAGSLGILASGRLRIAVVAWALFLAATLVAFDFMPGWLDHLPKGVGMHTVFSDLQRFRLWFLFALGALMYLYASRIPMRLSFGVLAVGILVATLAFGGYEVIGRVAFAYVCIWLAVYLPIRDFDRRGDFSYGLYIYGWLVAQMLAVFNVYELGPLPFMAITTVVAFGFAVLSWHLVEAPAQRLKSITLETLGPAPLRASMNAILRRGAATIATVLR
jgi:peptidoglycan/LPS O-acetylase OafA/YrhL